MQADGEFGRRYKSFGSAKTHHGGSNANKKGSGKHFTAIIIGAASEKIAPLFTIAAGRNVMESWTMPLDKAFYKPTDKVPQWLSQAGWLPSDCVMGCTENGSIDMATMPHLIDHVNKFALKSVSSDKAVVLFRDGHSSWRGIEWLEKSKAGNIEIINFPANTTHFLQPCDKIFNK